MDKHSSYFFSSKDNLLNLLPELSEDTLVESKPNKNSDETIYYSQVQPVQNTSDILNKFTVNSQTGADSKRKRNKSRKIPLIESTAYQSSPVLPARYRPNSLQHSISNDDILKSIDSVQNVTANLHYSSKNQILTLPRSFSSQPETSQLKNSCFSDSDYSIDENLGPPVPPKGSNSKLSSTLPYRGKGYSSGLTSIERHNINSNPVDYFESTSLSKLLIEVKLPIVVKLVKGYCVDDDDNDDDHDETKGKSTLTEGDQLMILNLCSNDCAKIYLSEESKTISIPSNSECKFHLMSAIAYFDDNNRITVEDLINRQCFSGRLRVTHGFTHPQIGLIECNTLISLVNYDPITKSIVAKNHQGCKFNLSTECFGEFSTHLIEEPSKVQNHLNICVFPQRVIIVGDFITGFMKQYIDAKVGFIEHYGKEDFLFCKELVTIEGSLIPGKSWILPIDDEIWVERIEEIKVFEHGYDVLNPDWDYTKFDSRMKIKDPKQRFYEKEISDLKILRKRLEFKISNIQKELKNTKLHADETIATLRAENFRLSKELGGSKEKVQGEIPSLSNENTITTYSCMSPQVLGLHQQSTTFADVLIMKPKQIGKLLQQLNLTPYVEIFDKEKINGDFFLLLEESDLIDLNISKRLDRKKLLRVKDLLTAGEDISNYLNN
ncbi:hypothetical protein LOD99_1589 [Oopsacas minuta]|uniref:SAM domain-containing protein n=1 Tax=Oopsacas minuta TaxID=111878 RepID=A0AAV7K5G5_9METZ|nr:hypothetical protein LOD99_1589 [Oopsacas minuta]